MNKDDCRLRDDVKKHAMFTPENISLCAYGHGKVQRYLHKYKKVYNCTFLWKTKDDEVITYSIVCKTMDEYSDFIVKYNGSLLPDAHSISEIYYLDNNISIFEKIINRIKSFFGKDSFRKMREDVDEYNPF